MSYDKYIKYKSKYLQLKAKYTQVGGAGMWTISYKGGQPKTTPITQEESNALNEVISKNMGKEVIINFGDLKDKYDNKLVNVKGEMNYKYVINADGINGKRISYNGEYDMSLLPDVTQGASAHPGAYGSSAPAYAPLSRASAYTPSSAPPAQPPRSASSVPFLYEIPDLPDYFTIYDKFDSDGKRYKIVCVKKFELMQHLTKIGDSITIDGIVYTKNTSSTIEMKTKNNYIYQLNNTSEGDTFCIYNK